MHLFIVESPTKAKKLSAYLGKEFTVRASVGHVRDLPKSTLGVNLEKDFEPEYVTDPGKMKVIKELEALAKKAEMVYLATDPDREGEAIAWHVKYLLSHDNKGKVEKKQPKFLRAVFHEITKPAVLAAIEHPGSIKMDLVDAQQARRVVDRLVGYQLSPVLWKKVRRGLSAGRVQSVALRLIAEREREIEAFKAEEYWEVDVLLNSTLSEKVGKSADKYKNHKDSGIIQFDGFPSEMFVARMSELDGKKYEPTNEKHVTSVVEGLKTAAYQVKDMERKERRRASLPPFTTSTLQQAGANRLGFSGKQTMTLAQQLYEEGLITYHRTDSVSLSQQAIEMARHHIGQKYGEKYLPEQPRVFANKSKNAQEAHEAIRPTDLTALSSDIGMSPNHQKLYDLIWRRFVATQMETAIYDQTTIVVESKFSAATTAHKTALLRASGSILKFDGWMKLFPNQGDTLLPSVHAAQQIGYEDLLAAQKFTQPPARFNDASLIKTLEEKGIGRPSTYASIISVIVDRGYVERKEKRFYPTSVGLTVSDFLVANFPVVMEYDFTAEMEEDLDRIARGEKDWKKIMKEFYTSFAKTVKVATDKADRVQIPVEETGELCPKCGESEKGQIVIRTGRFGKFKSCSRFPECDFTDKILDIVEGVHCPLCREGQVISKNTRWGKSFFGCARYPECHWASWKKPEPGETITQAEWDVLQKEREERKAKKLAKRAEKFGGQSDGVKSSSKKVTKKKPTKKAGKKRKSAAKKTTPKA